MTKISMAPVLPTGGSGQSLVMLGSLLLVAGLVLALAAWAFLFRRPPEGIWPRTWFTAGVLSAFAVAAMAATDRLTTVVGPISPVALAAGLGIGAAWLVATHIGHSVLCRLFPGFLDQITDLYSLREGDRVSTMVGPVVAMAVAEELFFRGFVQGRLGLLGAVVVYTLVQVVAGKWALTLAALLGGAVWGGLLWLTDGLLAPVVAHVLWTGALTFVWPLRGCGRRVGAADAAPLADGASCDRSPAPLVVEPDPAG
ncbi:CPBP family intramembrane metalloprotease [Aquihabitans sp. G128]|uniref:CPBP family intramembrane glutamic endopeptidase n=1 Tax=Aquihabitans sp. G128 TaxID=2849779 RepID=UPI001C24B905|nr:CPBP family intramembrane glutamic endopeptidase [Aquihabitans sp. G128]QXC61232.1 CPBP family intramembrane metalloprotease [Aquihabitans sp. G128]